MEAIKEAVNANEEAEQDSLEFGESGKGGKNIPGVESPAVGKQGNRQEKTVGK